MKILVLFFLFFASPLKAAPAELIPLSVLSKNEIAPKLHLSQEQVREDVQSLEAAFRNGYGGWDPLQDQFNSTVFPAWDGLDQAFVNSNELCHRIGKALDALPDSHLSVFYLGGSDSCGKSIERKGSVGPNIMPMDERPWGYFERKVNGQTIPILALTHLPAPLNPKWDGFLDKVRLIYKSAPALIIDLRGNGGGNDTMPKQMASILYGIDPPSQFPYPKSKIIRRQTPDALAILTNNFSFQILMDHLNGREPSLDLIAMQNLEASNYQQALNGELPTEDMIESPPVQADLKKVFLGPIRILVDAECGSSCETTIESFELHPNAKTVGENTAGYVHFGSMGYWWMKNSNLFVSIPTQRRVFADGRSVEKIGYAPSIPVRPGSDALDAALKSLPQNGSAMKRQL